MPSVEYKDNIDHYLKQLRIAGISMQEAGAAAINKAAWTIYGQYRQNLIRGTLLRNREFTLKAIRVFEAHGFRSDKKTLRKMQDINAQVGVVNFSSGGQHYLAKLEFGNIKRGSAQMQGKVGIPLDPARQGDDRTKAVSAPNRIGKGGGIKGVIDLSRFEGNPRQQYAIMQSMNRRGVLYTQNKNKQVSRHGNYWVKYGGGKAYIYSVSKKEARITRDMSFSQTTVKAEPHFEDAIKTITQSQMDRWFIQAAHEMLRNLEMGV